MEIKLILLDFDGTLADTGRANAISYIEALNEEGIKLSLELYYKKYFGVRCAEFMAGLGLTDAKQIDRIRERKVEIYKTHFDLISLNKPLYNFVQSFRKQGGKAWVVSTGHIKNITNAMHYLGIENDFDGIITANDVANSKPAPDCFIKAMESENVLPSQTLIFEDSSVGIAAAKASGAAYIKVTL